MGKGVRPVKNQLEQQFVYVGPELTNYGIFSFVPGTLHPNPKTLPSTPYVSPKPYTLNPKPYTLHPKS